MKPCPECYSTDNRATPILNGRECLENHTQYICGTCGRCICIEADKQRGLQRWNFPFKSLEIAKLYLRTADFATKQPCGIYEAISETGRQSYKIFATDQAFLDYLKKSKKTASSMKPLYKRSEFELFPNTEIRKLTAQEIDAYLGQGERV